LLVDSLPLSLAAGCAGSVFAASAVWPFAGCVPSAAGVVVAAGAFGSAAAVGGAAALGSESVVAGASVAGASTVDPPAAPLPGVATSITAVLPAGLEPPAPAIRVWPPPVKTSPSETDSVSGCICGAPFRAATTTPAADGTQPANGQTADAAKTDPAQPAANDKGKESTSKKKKGIKKIIPW